MIEVRFPIRWFRWLWLLLIVISAGPLVAATPSRNRWEVIGFLVAAMLYSGLGLILAQRRQENRVGWLLLAAGAGFFVQAAVTYRFLGPPQAPDVVDYIAIYLEGPTGSTIGLLVPLGLLLHWFPTGRALSRRWAWAGWLGAGLVAVELLGGLFVVDIGPVDDRWAIENPIGFLPSNAPFQFVSGLGSVVLLTGGALAMTVRYLRSSDVVRAQIKWVAYTAVFTGGAYVAMLTMQLFEHPVAIVAMFVGFLSIPVSITLAILRYRLFSIDRLISRTVGYAVVVGLLGTLFLALTSLPSFLIGGGNVAGDAARVPPALVGASTLAVAALFNPLRKRVLSWIDRRFHRSHYDAEQVVATFAARVNDHVDVEQLGADSIAVACKTMHPKSIGIWIRER